MKTKDKIITSAKVVFQKKGFSGARMQEIADESGINKALLHYHFKNKEVLFRSVLMGGFMEVFPVIFGILNSNQPLREKIHTVVDSYIDHISKNPQLPGFVLNELTQNPEFLKDHLQGVGGRPQVFVDQINDAIENGEIEKTDPYQIIADIVGLSVFPFIGKPLIQLLSGKNEKEFQQFIQERKQHVQTLLINGLYK